MGDNVINFIGVMVLCIIFLIFGISMGHTISTNHYRKQAVERGYAEYNSQTGYWQWKDNK